MRSRELASLAAALACVWAVAACGSEDEGSEPRAAAVTDAQRQMVNSPLANPSAFTRDLLADGILTYTEYEQAILGYKRCMEALGWTVVREWMPTVNHGYSSRWRQQGLPGKDDERLEGRPDLGTCDYDWGLSELSFVWIQTNRPSEAHLQEVREALGACFRAEGIDVPEHPSQEFLMSLFYSADSADHPVRACQSRIEEEFDLPGFFG